MSDRHTPETDKYVNADWWTLFRATEHARKLERERDEAREQLSAAKHFLEKYIAERDEAITEIQRLRYDAQREAENHDRLVKELESLYDKLKS